MHWRWGQDTLGLFSGGDRGKRLYGDGQLLIGDNGGMTATANCNSDGGACGSNQTVDIALVNDRPGIEKTDNFRDLLGTKRGDYPACGLEKPYDGKYGETCSQLGPGNIAMWYVSTVFHKDHDVFFAHGGFFDAHDFGN